MHEHVLLPCLFGCSGQKDRMSHYVFCPILFSILLQSRDDPSPNPLIRIGLVHPSKEGLLLIAAAFGGYHAVRRGIRLEDSIEQLDIQQRHAAHKIFADAFWVEALDSGLPCRHFRPSLDFSVSSCLPVAVQD